MSNDRIDNTNPTDNKDQPIYKNLSDLGLIADLYLSLNYHYVKVNKRGWLARFKKKKEALDIDIGCLLFDKHGAHVDTIWYKNLRDKSESICHYGDELDGYRLPEEKPVKQNTDKSTETNTTKQQEKTQSLALSPVDLESIHIQLLKLPIGVHEIALIVSSFQAIPLSKALAGGVELQDVEGNTAIRVELSNLPKNCCSLWLASLYRGDNLFDRTSWRLFDKQQPLPHASIDSFAKQVKLPKLEREKQVLVKPYQ